MNHVIPRILGWATALATGAVLHGQSTQVPAAPQEGVIVVENARLHPVSDEHPEVIENGWIIFEDGRITGIGSGTAPDADGEERTRIDAEGLTLVPGFVSAPSQLGLLEVGAVSATDDRREAADRSPEAAPWIAVNPDSDLIPVARSAGILHTLAVPTGGTIPGQVSVLRMDGWTTEDLAVIRNAGVVLSWPMASAVNAPWMRRGGREQRSDIDQRMKAIDRWFDEAEAWTSARDADPTIRTDLRFQTMGPVLRGERPIFIRADSRGQIETALAWAMAREYRAVIVGGSAAGDCVEVLRASGAPVILTRVHRKPASRHHPVDAPLSLPMALHEAGIPFAIGCEDEPAHERSLAHNAATAAAHGLPRAAALRAVTRSPAEIIGVGDRLGSLDTGRSATFFLCEGDPLEVSTLPLRAWIDGREIDLGDRQKRLHEKYREKYRRGGLLDG